MRFPAKRREPAGVQALETGLSILAAFIDLEPLPMLKTIAERAGMPPAKAHRYLASFCRSGFVERDPQSGRYRLAPLALRLGLAAMNGLDAVRVARPVLVDMCRELQQSVFVAVWGTTGATIVLLEHVQGPITVTARVGITLPLLSSSTGRTFAAWLPRAVTRQLLELELAKAAKARTAGVPCSLKQAEEQFDEIRKRGLARNTGQLNPVVNALSAPVFDHSGQIAAVLSALGPARSFSTDFNGPLAARLKAAAVRLSLALGHPATGPA